MDEERSAAIAEAMADIRAIDSAKGMSREAVEQIRDRLVQLAEQRHLFSFDAFPPPTEGPKSYLYRLAQDEDDRFALYANASRGDVSTPTHNHTTWAVVVGFEGQELNKFYRRTSDDRVEQIDEHMVEAGTGVAMVGDDLHSIHIDGPALNFHCYGLALERLDSRQFYDPKADEWRTFPPSSDIREARPGLMPC